jgi:hypothetical protein
MSNQLDVIIPQILARGLATLRENIVMPFLVNRGYQAEAAQRGDTVTIPVPSAMSAVDVTTGITPGDPTDFITPSSVTIPLDKWKKSDFSLTDKDLVEIQEGYLPLQAEEAVKALANQVDSDLLGMANGFYGFSAVLGQPLAQMSDLVEARKVLNQQLAPMDPRYIVVGPQGEAEMLGIQAFHDASFGVGGEAILEGRIVRRLGFGIAMDQNVADLSQGDMTDATVSGEGSSLSLTVNSGVAPSVGDIVEIASQAGTFVITSINGGNTAIEVAPAIAGTIDPGTPAGLTYPTEAPAGTSYEGRMAFHRDAMAFVTRPLSAGAEGLGTVVRSISDPESRLTLRLEISRENKQTRWCWDILYGFALIRRELGVRMGGTNPASL